MNMESYLYLDNNATTRMDEAVLQAKIPFELDYYANPSALYGAALIPKTAIGKARDSVAHLVNAQPQEIVFTSGGTEADNTAIHSAIECFPHKKHIVISAVEHPAVANCVASLEKKGYQVTRLIPTPQGVITPLAVASSIRPNTVLVSIMAANNETGVINPIYQIGEIVKRNGSLYHIDATQAIGKIPIDFKRARADYMAFSAHKFHGPKGVGILVVKTGACYRPLVVGGGQENECRAGTENVAGIVGAGVAAQLALNNLSIMNQIADLRDWLQTQLKKKFGNDILILGEGTQRTPNTLMVAFRNVNGRELQSFLADRHIAIGIGSACSCIKKPKPSATVVAMNVPPNYQLGTMRVSLSKYNLPKGREGLMPLLKALDDWKTHSINNSFRALNPLRVNKLGNM